MKLIVLGSDSKGNGYILTNGTETLIIECGISLAKVKKALDFNVSSIVGVLVSHRHGDHAKYLSEYLRLGAKVFAGEDVILQNNVKNAAIIQPPLCKTKIGGFTIVAFNVFHDVPTYGFHIHHQDSGNILFLTDTYMCEYTFPALSHILVEANYAEDILTDNVAFGRVDKYTKERVWRSHMELETTKGVIKSNDLSMVRNIVLIHLSEKNSNEKRFIDEMQAISGRPVSAAKKGLILNFSL